MADITYTLTDSLPEEISGFEQYSDIDKNLIESFRINSLFDPQKHFTEIHIYSIADELLESDSNYNRYKLLGNAQSTGNNGASVLTIDPIADSINYGYTNGGVKVLYHFINDLFTPDKSTAEFFINGISDDRTELRLLASTLDGSIVEQTAVLLAENLKNQSYFDGFRLNFGSNDLLIGINIGILDYNNQKAVTIKLYEPLPDTYDLGSTLTVVETISDSISYEIEAQIPVEEFKYPTLRSANFNIDIQDHSVVPSEYLSYNDLFSYPVNNSNSQIYSMFNEKGIDISVNYDTFNDFAHFSSVQERLINFKYKLDLLSSYSASLAQRSGANPTLAGTSGSKEYYNNLITGVVSNFDHYERHLYYKSGSTSWPKTNNTNPYTNAQSLIPGTTTPNPVVTTWYSSQVNNAAYYDSINTNLLINTIPSYLRDDINNENYLTFIHMIGQHFDNLWLYGKAVSDKYDADNRLDYGISRDLVAEALKNFGIQLYTSNKSVQDLFTTIIGQSYQSGSEQITNYITGSYTGSNAPIQPSSYDSYQKEVYKRIYHNLPLLLNAKGTERGLRALINCFGIPQDILQIKLYGGRNINERPFYGDYRYYTSSLDKIRIENTGSIVTGSTLSNYTSIVKRDNKYTDDLHPIEVGFSPTDNVDNYIISKSLSTASLSNFDIDDYLGDPKNLTLDTYYTYTPTGEVKQDLKMLTNSIMSGSQVSGSYDVQDYVRLIKFFDNTIFKMIKDFIPARAVADTGIIIKPYILGRSKAKSVSLSGSRPEYTASIDTAFLSAKSPNNFRDTYNGGEANTQYIDYPQTPTGIGIRDSHFQNQPNYNGEVSGSFIRLSDIDLNTANPYKAAQYSVHPYPVYFISSSNEVCLLNTVNTTIPFYITSSTQLFSANEFFTFTNSNCVYSVSNTATPPVFEPITFPRSFTTTPSPLVPPNNRGYFRDFFIRAINNDIPLSACQKDIQVRFATCSMYFSPTGISTTNVKKWATGEPSTNLTTWVTNLDNQTLQYTLTWDVGGTSYSSGVLPTVGTAGTTVSSYNFTQPEGTYVTLTVKDPNVGDLCQISKEIYVGVCTLGLRQKLSNINPANSEQKRGFEFIYSLLTIAPAGTFLGGADGQSITQNFSPGYVGFTNSSDLPTRYIGIQGYFTHNGILSSNLCQDPEIRYNIFKLTNARSQPIIQPITSTEPPPYFNLTTIIQGLDPSTPLEEWGGGGLVGSTPQDSTFIDTADLGDISLYGVNPQTFHPIMLVTDSYNQFNGTSAVRKAKEALVYAYVIQAYRAGLPSCKQTVVVYGQHLILGTGEGLGASPYFTPRNILVDWNYASTIPTTTFPVVPAGPYGPWVSIKLRSYGQSEQVPLVTP